jgi:hypothetical protein
MTTPIDARAYSWCSLGPLSEEGCSIAEDHAQGIGVIMLKGTINLKGVHRPTSGTVVHLAYSDGQNWIARLPLRLRVLSCSSNPITDRTAVSVGCDFAFYENRKEPVTLDTRDENINIPEAQWRAQAPAISSAWLVGMILCILRIRYDGNIPLTNYRTVQDFDMSAGYVEELSKLCASEGYVCRMNEDGKAEFIYKEPAISAGPLILAPDLIDLNPINVGELPGDSVYAKYNSLKLQAPDSQESEDKKKKRNWEEEITIGQLETFVHDWTEYIPVPTGRFKRYKDSYGNDMNFSDYPGEYLPAGARIGEFGLIEVPVYEVKGFPRRQEIDYIPYTKTQSFYDKKDRVTLRVTEKQDQWGSQFTYTRLRYTDTGAASGNINNNPTVAESWTNYVCEYEPVGSEGEQSLLPKPAYGPRFNGDTGNGEINEESTIEIKPLAPVRMSLGLQASYDQLKASGTYTASRRVVTYERSKKSGITKTVTRNFVPYIQTQDGSEILSRLRDRRNPWDPIDDQSGWVTGVNLTETAIALVESGSETKIRTEREFGIQRRPRLAERTTEANRKVPDVEEEARIAWAVGSAASQTAIELSPPYVSDDRVINVGGAYIVIPSDAPRKVLRYARIENRYLLGHRNGNGIQLLPEMLDAKPLSIAYIRLNGCTGAFLVNGRTWTIGPSSGVTMTCDALFWGAVDGTAANAWFPLPPGATSLPSNVSISQNANPKPANAISIPSGFDFADPDTEALFNALPINQPAVFPAVINPGSVVKPYNEAVSLVAGCEVGAAITRRPWVSGRTTELAGGCEIGALITRIGTRWVSDASVYTPGIPVLMTKGVNWVTNSTIFTPGIPVIGNGVTVNITSPSSLTSYTVGQLEFLNFGSYDDFVGGTMVLTQTGSIYTVEFFLPSGTNAPITLVFSYDIDAGSSAIDSITQTYTGSVSGVSDNFVDGFIQGDSYATLAAGFSASSGTLLSIKHTIAIA